MSTENTTASRTVVLYGRGAGERAWERTITLVDDAGNALDRAWIDDDGHCELAVDALAAAQEVVFAVNVSVSALEVRELLESTDAVDVATLLAGPSATPAASTREIADHPKYFPRPAHPHPTH